jgi:glycosyltransferase involved in cell wall biosynthesis
MIKVSVILPVYNVENYLRECLESLVNQTLKDIEIICINDCSTDNSLNILNEYMARDSRITLIDSQKKLGAAESRNLGIQLAKGEYLSILDSDDFCDPNFLDIVYKRCSVEKADIGLYDYANYNNLTKEITDMSLSKHFAKYKCKGSFTSVHIRDYIFQLFSCAPWSKLYNREFVLESKIKFQNLENANDTYFGNMILTKAKKMIYINTDFPLYFYRINVSTQTSNNRSRNPRCVWKALLEIKKSLVIMGIFNKFSRSFYSYAVANLYYSLNSVNDEQKKELYHFLSFEGLEQLGMINCSEHDFISRYEYMRYEFLKSCAFEKINQNFVAKQMYIDNAKAIELFESLSKSDCRFGLWGIGLFGKAFFHACKHYDFTLSALIDENPSKTGVHIDNYVVKSFGETLKHIDAVIITNTHFGKGISKVIQQANKEIKLIDIDAFFRLGLKLEECIF